MKRKGEMGKVKTCANEQNAKLALAFYCECSQVSSTRSVVKARANEWAEIHLRKIWNSGLTPPSCGHLP